MSAEGVVAGVGAGSAERAYRRALRAYPRRYRRERGDEIISTLLDAVDGGGAGAGGGAASAPRRELLGLVAGGLRCRLRSGDRWWEALRAFQLIAVALLLALQIERAWSFGEPFLTRPWAGAPLVLGLLSIVALVTSAAGATRAAWTSGAALTAAAAWGLVDHRAFVAAASSVVFLLGPLALSIQGPRARRWSAASVLPAVAVAFSFRGPIVEGLHLPALVLVVALASPRLARGLALYLALAAAIMTNYGAPVVACLLPRVGVGVAAVAWAALLERALRALRARRAIAS